MMTARQWPAGVSLPLCASLALALGACKVSKPESEAIGSQGWSPTQRALWYEGTQGSRLLPYAWFQALEQADRQEPFASAQYLAGFRFLPRTTSQGAERPIGLALDDNDDSQLTRTKLRWFEGQGPREPWIGLNCSACHTGLISYKGEDHIVDGGPALLDFQGFVRALDAALTATRDDPAKWQRFAAKVLAGKAPADEARLRAALDRWIASQKRASALNEAATLPHGFGRLDAFGHIYNAISLLVDEAEPVPAPTNAPVSYPFLWDVYRHNKLQYTGVAASSRVNMGGRWVDFGAIGRDVGEMIGAYADISVPAVDRGAGFPSSIWANSLTTVSATVSQLQPPRWPASFGAPDPARVQSGKALFDGQCRACHGAPPAGTDIYAVSMVPLRPDRPEANTDPWTACNTLEHVTGSGRLRGYKSGYVVGYPIRAADSVLVLLRSLVTGAMAAKLGDIFGYALGGGSTAEDQPPPPLPRAGGAPGDTSDAALQACFAQKGERLAYKARPLNGVWATAPYLHNGSVPTLYDLLLPAAKRPRSFALGTREYDPVKVGYLTGADAPGNSFTFVAVGKDGRPVAGNSNAGHDYRNSELSDEQRAALVEYLKTL